MPGLDDAPPLERYMRILELLAGFPDGLSLSEITAMLGLPKPSGHRLLKSMLECRLVETRKGGATSYLVGARMRRLIYATTKNAWLDSVVRGYLRELVQETGETAYITKLEHGVVRSILTEAPDTPWRGYVLPGSEMHVFNAATAKAIAAYQDAETVEHLLAQPLTQRTSKTKSEKSEVMADLESVRARGYATCLGEVDEGLAAIGVPLMLGRGEVIFSLGITGPYRRVVDQGIEKLAETMKRYAAEMSAAITVGFEKQRES
ncbi:helix-turn-helix domain-containing protein [Paraburkholderia sp. Ac-20342]|uniref:IclR family transcriptional regulator n=1 Tax=Paraburkholderia sp. Ac-20342 TaxID=2703889 RepID=UPI00197F514B|nr:IclR family transcriptional regulator C-terminal domain-containing protein [Paraburkholderia sp. Ac-20342]MBN3846029.1 helix-turn-helix domain-containing protein [Paraburkholderia sp. Ac-20342]